MCHLVANSCIKVNFCVFSLHYPPVVKSHSCMISRIGGFGPATTDGIGHRHHLMAKGQGESKSLGLSSRACSMLPH